MPLTLTKPQVIPVLLLLFLLLLLLLTLLLPQYYKMHGYGNVKLYKKILVPFIMSPGLFLALLSNSGMSSVPSPRSILDVIKYNLFHVPGIVAVCLMYYDWSGGRRRRLDDEESVRLL
jgi:hypothetical protein